MRKDNRRSPISLSLQVVAALVVLIILASLAIGIPAIWLIREQLDQLAWTLVSQASQTTQATLAARQSELINLAILTAQRPTLLELAQSGDRSQLSSYLDTLREGAGLDLVLLCGQDGKPIAQVGLPISGQACQTVSISHIYQSPSDSGPMGWILASRPILDNSTNSVVVGQRLDDDFLDNLRHQTGVEQIFLFAGQMFVATIPYDPLTWETVNNNASLAANPLVESMTIGEFALNGILHYAARSRYDETELEIIVSLPITNILAVQRGLTWTMSGGIAIVILLTSTLGFILAKRLGSPLDRLRDAAIALRRGDLDNPIPANFQVREVTQVAYALEDARIALRHTLEQLRLEKAWGDHLLASVVEGIITLDRQDRVTFFSQGAERITGWKKERVLAKSIDDVFQMHATNERFSQRIQVPAGKQEIVTVLINGRPVTLAITGARLAPTEAGKAHLALVLRDVTNEEAIRRLLGDFLANITHEFRTPLTAQAVSIELLLDQLDELETVELRELLTAHYLGVLSLQTLVDNLLEGASIEAGKFRVSPQPTELAEVIPRATQTMEPLMEKYALQLHVVLPEGLPLVQADARRTHQVLVNLLSNAIKWSPRDSEILLCTTIKDREVKISVTDQGPGIPPEQKGELFTWLPNLQSKNVRADHGTGLGLSVVRAIVEAQGGRVGVEDGPAQGAVFWFTIPVFMPQVNEGENS